MFHHFVYLLKEPVFSFIDVWYFSLLSVSFISALIFLSFLLVTLGLFTLLCRVTFYVQLACSFENFLKIMTDHIHTL